MQSNYDVDFPMFAKVDVNGDGAAPLYELLRAAKPGDIAWNFTKFLVDGAGNVVERFEPQVTPEDIAPRVRELLG